MCLTEFLFVFIYADRFNISLQILVVYLYIYKYENENKIIYQRFELRIMKIIISAFVILSYIYMSDANLTNSEKKLLLDSHNQFRKDIALGNVQGQPRAANMKELVIDGILLFQQII